jgi:hypothetical protein
MVGCEIELLRDPRNLTDADKNALLIAMDDIARSYRHVSVPHWSNEHSPFVGDYVFLVAQVGGRVIGYSVLKCFELLDGPGIYRAGSEIHGDYQGHGIYRAFADLILSSDLWPAGHRGTRYYAWRTRNPIVWASNAKLCREVVPSLVGGCCGDLLVKRCHELCRQLFPDQPIEHPSMIMRNIYPNIHYFVQPTHRSDNALNRAFSPDRLGRSDGIMSLGVLVEH